MTLGYVEAGEQWLYLEEAIFLMEKGLIEVLECTHLSNIGGPLSFQDLLERVGSEHYNSVTFEELVVYLHLKNNGYIVKRIDEWNEPRDSGASFKVWNPCYHKPTIPPNWFVSVRNGTDSFPIIPMDTNPSSIPAIIAVYDEGLVHYFEYENIKDFPSPLQ